MKFLSELQSVKKRVEHIYSCRNESVHSDVVLLSIYKKIFGKIEHNEASIQRAGRSLRRENPSRFQRSDFKHFQDLQYEKAVKEVFSQ